jgi:hypothetical protein
VAEAAVAEDTVAAALAEAEATWVASVAEVT